MASQKLLAEANATAQGKVDQGGQEDHHEQRLTCAKHLGYICWVKDTLSMTVLCRRITVRTMTCFVSGQSHSSDAAHVVHAAPDHHLHSHPGALGRVPQQSKSLQMRELIR